MRPSERDLGRDVVLRWPNGAARRANQMPKLVIVIWLLAMAARLLFINQPFIDHWSWRQSDVAAIARNFFENGFGLGYPQGDWAGSAPGYVGIEFPTLSDGARGSGSTFWWTQWYPEFAAEVTNNATLIEATPEFRIYRLNPVAR